MLGRRPVYIPFEDLKKVLGLPEEVNIYNVEVERNALKFEIVSPEPIAGLTVEYPQEGEGLIRRISFHGIQQWNEEQNK
ncbi:hypothetical protein PQE68_gp235 [Bacillus phage vB_BanS_Sophrita]|uniref:Uncharacterized protein n=1 Tax=Bacillus phage vB_BanS_Sophrita TaxID=2894790 RepID=A0AAE8YXW7_9CAUD|nr:hypothetical protein PQE68_gp235 [Bacillus phage vB_BanS_Sophrita]UGO50847.1 hypothetical protein SOPHRITA_260 [Bacillus phage vB_BanS_Sophrita]